jgi:hypothetical protein
LAARLVDVFHGNMEMQRQNPYIGARPRPVAFRKRCHGEESHEVGGDVDPRYMVVTYLRMGTEFGLWYGYQKSPHMWGFLIGEGSA